MGTPEINPSLPGNEPELHLLLANDSFEEPLWKSLFQQLDELFFPKKLPPLKLESKPEPVRDIWGFYNYRKDSAVASTGVHVLIVAMIIAGTLIGRRMVQAAPAQKPTVTLVDPGPLPDLKPSKTQVGGGGGGGDRDILQATRGKLPKFSMTQITPPVVVVRNEHPKLAVEPTIVIPPQVQLATIICRTWVTPCRTPVLPSNGTGSGSGIGSGEGGGVGSGKGPGFGPGERRRHWRRHLPRGRRRFSAAADLCS